MTDPFFIEGPAMISFSGGRTSAYMLRRILDVGVQPDVHVLFANTGKERLETLDFIHRIETEWHVPVHWVEYRSRQNGGEWQEVTYDTASRNGEPYAAAIAERSYLPNPVTRYCTTELKVRVMRNWMRAAGYDDADWTNVVGLRADEPRRVANMRARVGKEGAWEIALPLAEAGITVTDIMAFWKTHHFDLQLQPHEGNCDLCFLKGISKKQAIIRDHPELAVWWMQQETQVVGYFRNDQPSYSALHAQTALPWDDDQDALDCFCTD